MDMQSALFPGLPMQRDGSGTSWLPDSTPMHAIHFRSGSWSYMLHGNLFLRYTNQDAGNDGTRGNEKFDAPNWLMVMAKRDFGDRGQIMLRGMSSLDLVTEGGMGYPLLFQSGETWKGKSLVDRQHPHDLFGELSVAYSRSIGEDSGGFLYFGLPGEPALGPPVYLHRPSSQNNPDAPLGHHWQDSSHVTFGVMTAGIYYKQFKLDASLFNGREPDEDRYNIDRPRFNSASIRLSMNPSPDLALQVSYGYIKSPESHEPDVNVQRTTASAVWSHQLDAERNLAASLVWGMNKPNTGKAQNAFLFEADYGVGKMSYFTRLEHVSKTGEELGLGAEAHQLFSVKAISLGISRDIYYGKNVSVSLGAMGTIYPVEKELRSVYGAMPFSVEAFLKISPARLQMMHHAMGHDMGH
ncbi:MAG: hypothetical protein HZA15_11365 [Nitrospirae bacterium]|nr:hypothetical protein [Nitrospirota bacterium]